MEDLTRSINSGKNDWEKMREALNPDLWGSSKDLKKGMSFGHSAMPSDVSANKGIEGGEFDSRTTHQNVLTANFQKIRNSKTFKQEMSKNRRSFVHKKKKNIILNSIKNNITEMDNEPIDVLLNDEIENYESMRQSALNSINSSIDEYNKIIHDAIKAHGRGLHTGWSAMPKINSYNDLKDLFVSTVQSAPNATVLRQLFPIAGSRIFGSDIEKLEEARLKSNAPTAANIPERVEEFINWLHDAQMKYYKGDKGYNYLEMSMNNLESVLKGATNLEVYESILKELKLKLKEISALSPEDKKDKQKIIPLLTAITDVDLSNDPAVKAAIEDIKKALVVTQQQLTESIEYEREAMTTNGKTVPKESNKKELVDILNRNNKKLQDAYSKYYKTKSAPDPIKDKPDDFNLAMG